MISFLKKSFSRCCLIFGLSLCFSSPEAKAQVFVGNGGEGVKIGMRIYARDLVEFNVHQQISSKPKNPGTILFSRDEIRILNSLAISKTAFAQKISEIESSLPGMAPVLRLGLNSFHWKIVKGELPRMNDETPAPRWFDQGRVQVAIRMKNQVAISQSYWQKMDPQNRIAIVFHEVIYSLMEVECDAAENCNQSPGMTREIVGRLFGEADLQKEITARNMLKRLQLGNHPNYRQKNFIFTSYPSRFGIQWAAHIN